MLTPPDVTAGKLARTLQVNPPTPLIVVGAAAVVSMLLASPHWPFAVGQVTSMSYDIAPGTGSHVKVGIAVPAASLVTVSNVGTGSVFWNVPVGEYESPRAPASMACTRQ